MNEMSFYCNLLRSAWTYALWHEIWPGLKLRRQNRRPRNEDRREGPESVTVVTKMKRQVGPARLAHEPKTEQETDLALWVMSGDFFFYFSFF
jgi:hypothetical protein